MLVLFPALVPAQVMPPFANSDSLSIEAIRIRGNRKTKAYVIVRELPFRAGDCILRSSLPALLEQGRTQLNNTSLFGSILVEDSAVGPDRIMVVVDLTERWYFFPSPVFELADRNINVWIKQFNADINRINFGINPTLYNLTGHFDELSGILQWGFTPKIEVEYTRPYLARSERHGIGVMASYSVNRQVPFINQADQEQFVTLEDFSLTRFRVLGKYLRRRGAYHFHTLEAKYSYNRISDTIALLNPDFFLDGALEQQFVTLSYSYLFNRVDARAYPLVGTYTEITGRKIGLGLFGNLHQWSFVAKHNQYFELPYGFYAAYQLIGKTTLGREHPYHNIEGLGFCQDLVRGYELYAIDGQDYALVKTNLKHRLFKVNLPNPLNKNPAFGGIPLSVYLKAYGDAGYVNDRFYTEGNPLTNTLLLGGGMGLDFVTFYDWVIRVEYSFNRLGQNGLFLHAALDLDTYENCNLW